MVMDDKNRDLVEGAIDIAIRGGDLTDSSLIARKLTTFHSVLCASPGYLEAYGQPARPAQIREHNCLLFSYSAESSEWTLSNDHGSETIEVSGNYKVNNSEALREAILGGLGIGRLPSFVAGPDLEAGRLVDLFPTYKMPEKAFYAVFLKREYMPANVQTFLDFAIEKLTG